ncbi:uncharacterized protein LOC135378865 [Ornithodoros turicata]|uniref:uncharacterized protein LOC135378865 n=1 Tax=Ornithodoros turicata TaxID=34597 RepID=UPI00313973AF
MSFVQKLPAMSPEVVKCMMRIHRQHGLHVYYDVPTKEVIGELPAHLFVGASVALFFFTYVTPVRFRVAVMHAGENHYVEMGLFENEFGKEKLHYKYAERLGKVAIKTQEGYSSDSEPVPHYDVAIDGTKPDVHHCMEYRFTDVKTTEFFFDGVKLGEEKKLAAALFHKIFNYVPVEGEIYNNVMFTELHVTCPKNMTLTLLPEDAYIHVDNLVFIGTGGSITITGEFKKSGDTSVTIESKHGYTVKPPKTFSKPDGADGEVFLVIFNRGHLLTCLIGGKEKEVASLTTSCDVPAVKVKNFDTYNVEFKTGLSDSGLVPIVKTP